MSPYTAALVTDTGVLQKRRQTLSRFKKKKTNKPALKAMQVASIQVASIHMAVGLISKPRNTSSQFTYHLLASLTAGWWIKVSVLIPGIIKRCSRCYVSPADSIAAVGSNFSCCPQCINCHDLPCLMVNIICRSAIFDASPDSILTLGVWKWFFWMIS